MQVILRGVLFWQVRGAVFFSDRYLARCFFLTLRHVARCFFAYSYSRSKKTNGFCERFGDSSKTRSVLPSSMNAIPPWCGDQTLFRSPPNLSGGTGYGEPPHMEGGWQDKPPSMGAPVIGESEQKREFKTKNLYFPLAKSPTYWAIIGKIAKETGCQQKNKKQRPPLLQITNMLNNCLWFPCWGYISYTANNMSNVKTEVWI